MLGQGGTWTGTLSVTAINNRVTSLEEKNVRSTRFASIGSGTTGSLTLPGNSTVILDDFGGATDAVITTISGGRPNFSAATTSGGSVIATTFDSSGNYSLSGTPSAYPVAIVYRVRQQFQYFNDADSDVIGAPTLEGATGALLSTNNLNDVASVTASRTNLGLGIGDSPLFAEVNLGGTTDTTFTRVSAGVAAIEGNNILVATAIGSTVQAWDTDLDAVAALNSTGFAVRSAAGTWVQRILTSDSNLTWANPGGVAGNASISVTNPNLTAFRSLTAAADALPYFTGATTMSTTTLSSFGRTLIDDADAGSARTTLGVAIGTNVQAWDAGLDAVAAISSTGFMVRSNNASDTWINRTITVGSHFTVSNGSGTAGNPVIGLGDVELLALASVTSAADKLPYFTGLGTAAVTNFSAFGRTLVDDADAGSARTTLGLGLAALETYEEGSWTPIATYDTPANFTPTYTNQFGQYVRVGDRVDVWALLQYNSNAFTGATGAFRMEGLPFVSQTVAGLGFWGLSSPFFSFVDFTTSVVDCVCFNIFSTDHLVFYGDRSSTSSVNFGTSAFVPSRNNIAIRISGSYKVV